MLFMLFERITHAILDKRTQRQSRPFAAETLNLGRKNRRAHGEFQLSFRIRFDDPGGSAVHSFGVLGSGVEAPKNPIQNLKMRYIVGLRTFRC